MTRRRVPAARIDTSRAPRQFHERWLRERLRDIGGALRGARLCVAFSAGLDSTALLAALATLRRRSPFELRAAHVNHHLQPLADEWAGHARTRARELGVDCAVLDVDVTPARGGSLEAAARSARYTALRAHLDAGEWLLTAHHQDDQFETVLLQLLRGAGLPGLAAMPVRAAFGPGWLLRPLLPVSRAALVDYLARRRLAWSEDPSNADPRFDRNYLRHEVLPALRSRWPAAAATVSRSAAHMAEAQALLDEEADDRMAAALDGGALRTTALRGLTLPRRRLVLRRWLRRQGLPMPDQARLREMATALLASRADAQPLLRWEGGEVRRHGDLLQAMRPMALQPTKPLRWSWQRRRSIELAEGARLVLQPHPHGNLDLGSLPPTLEVRFRGGGERLASGVGRKPLKNLLQELSVPPWLRDRVPLLHAGRRLVAVADLWLDSGYQAGPECKRRARLRWEFPPSARESANAH